MREIDKRTRITRRTVLRGAATAGPAAALATAGVAVNSEAAWADTAKTLSPHVMATLVLVARDTFPHDHLSDTYYMTAVAGYDTLAEKSPDMKSMLENGVARLDADAAEHRGADYLSLGWEEQRVAVLVANEHTPFFKKLRGDLVVSLYNQKAVWPKFGYEGASADKGGYIHRGFDDIDWLAIT